MKPMTRVTAVSLTLLGAFLTVLGAPAAYGQDEGAAPSPAAAAATGGGSSDNDQNVVIGMSLFDSYTFKESDDVRSAVFTDPGQAAYGHIYVEWYGRNRVGIGYRLLVVVNEEEVAGTDTGKLVFASEMLTLHYLPYISADKYSRIGVYGGYGSAEYTVTDEVNDIEYTATGNATTYSIYLDWGSEDFGARLGVGTLTTELGEVKQDGVAIAGKADVSGNFGYLDLRWAFQ